MEKRGGIGRAPSWETSTGGGKVLLDAKRDWGQKKGRQMASRPCNMHFLITRLITQNQYMDID